MDKTIFIISEIGMTHDGSMGQAKAMIRAAADSGVDAVKLQTHIADAETLRDAPAPKYFQNESRYSFFKRTEFDYFQLQELKDYAATDCSVEFLSSPFSIEAVELLEKVGVSSYKIPSGEVSNLPLIAEIAKTGKKIFLSSGMSTWRELDDAVKLLLDSSITQLTLLQCTSEYPCRIENAGLHVMKEMTARYGVPTGLSDHTPGIFIPIAAACLGATVIEKHFTLSRHMYGPDSQFSLTPDELTEMVVGIRTVELALASHLDKDSKASDLDYMKFVFEKSIVARNALPKEAVITPTDLSYKKPGDGIKANQYRSVIGKRVLRNISKDERIRWSDLTDA